MRKMTCDNVLIFHSFNEGKISAVVDIRALYDNVRSIEMLLEALNHKYPTRVGLRY